MCDDSSEAREVNREAIAIPTRRCQPALSSIESTHNDLKYLEPPHLAEVASASPRPRRAKLQAREFDDPTFELGRVCGEISVVWTAEHVRTATTTRNPPEQAERCCGRRAV